MQPASCKNCGKLFPNYNLMMRHHREKHSTHFEYTCIQCRRTYNSRTELDAHYRSRHPKQIHEAETIPGKRAAPGCKPGSAPALPTKNKIPKKRSSSSSASTGPKTGGASTMGGPMSEITRKALEIDSLKERKT